MKNFSKQELDRQRGNCWVSLLAWLVFIALAVAFGPTAQPGPKKPLAPRAMAGLAASLQISDQISLAELRRSEAPRAFWPRQLNERLEHEKAGYIFRDERIEGGFELIGYPVSAANGNRVYRIRNTREDYGLLEELEPDEQGKPRFDASSPPPRSQELAGLTWRPAQAFP